MRPSARQHASGARRRRCGGAAFAALLLAGALGVAGCSASDRGSAGSDKAPAAAADGAHSVPEAGSGSSDSGAVAEGNGNATAPSAPPAGAGNGKAPQLAPTYLVRTAELSIRTPHVENALQQARTLVAGAGGYAGDESTAVDAAGHATSTIQLRVPPAAYDGLLDDLGRLGTLVERKVSVDDVTSQVVDVQSRLKSQQASVDRVRKLMNQASGLSDVVSLESELSTRESALEALEAQQASLKAQTGLATVSLQLSEPPVKPVAHQAPKDRKDGFWKTVDKALKGGWHAFSATVRTVLVVLSALLPFLALGALVLVAWRLVRRWRPRTGPAEPSATLRPAGWLPGRPPMPGPRGNQADPGQDQQEGDPSMSQRAAAPEASRSQEEQGPPA